MFVVVAQSKKLKVKKDEIILVFHEVSYTEKCVSFCKLLCTCTVPYELS